MNRLSFLLAAAACVVALCASAAPPPFEDSMAQRAQACSACHGKEGRAAPDGYYPRIAGKPAGYLYNQLLNFRDGRRHYGLMTRMVDPLSDAYLMEIAQYFAALDLPYPPPQPARVEPALLERGRVLALHGDRAQRIPACAQCHGGTLTGVAPAVPGLLGLPRDYLNSQLGAWRTGQRRAHAPDCMAQIAKQLAPEDVNAITAWLSAQALPVSANPSATVPPLAAGAERIDCGSAPTPTTAGAAR